MRNKVPSAFSCAIVLLFIVFISAIGFGSSGVSVSSFFSKDETALIIFYALRLPRVLGAFFAGVAFSVSGVLIQTATANELASPNVVGINAGAGFFVLLFLSLFPFASAYLALASFLGAICAVLIVVFISSMVRSFDVKSTLILSGVAVGALFNAGISVISSLDPDVLSTYSAFSIGGFSGLYMENLYVPACFIIASFIASLFLAGRLNYLSLGDEIASSVGIRVRLLRRSALLLGALCAASAVTFSGLLGFVGLVVPHMARYIIGDDLRVKLPFSALLGAILVILADLLGRIVIRPSELPAGIFMAVIGVPFFLFLLLKRRMYD